MTLVTGTKLGRYAIRSKIGEGGMGEVYLALDTELDRTVAIKILPESLASNQQRLQRFIQEAKAASSLNHPHILTIHEIGEAGALRFIATEFIDGETLRPRIVAGMKLAEILEVTIQIAGALSAAHAAGIVHRDIKPENIMVRRDGYIKLLDFGLAKLTDPKTSATDPEAPTRALLNTDAGTVMGTANYMSPEQAKGTPVDARTDLWSLGAVLYEMVTGQLPFVGETPTETISLILQREPAPLTRHAKDVPAELERIVNKALTKDREGRYQTAKDLLIDLRNLKRRIEVDAEIDRSVPAELRVAMSTGSGREDRGSWSAPAIVPAMPTLQSSNAEYIVGEIKRHKMASALIAGLIVVAIIAGVIGVRTYLSPAPADGVIDSIAVLPFANTSKDANAEYLCDGITESLINTLSQVPSLRVISRNAVFRYKDQEVDAQKTANELKVRSILKGGLKQLGDQIVINVELIDARDNHQIWGEQYVRKFADVLALQREIVQEVSGKLRLKLTNADTQRLAKPGTDNPEAFRLYLQGRHLATKMTRESFDKGIAYLQKAIDLDPGYALAYSGVAYYYIGTVDQTLSPKEAMPKAREAALKAIALDDSLAEAHISLASVYWQYDWDWAKAEQEFKRALELNPNNAEAHGAYGFLLIIMGRFDQGIAEGLKGRDLSPLSLEANFNIAPSYYFARRYDLAIDSAHKTTELAPDFWLPYLIAGRAYEQKGQLAEAISLYQKAHAIDNAIPEPLMDLGRAYGLSGQRAEAERVLNDLKTLTKTAYASPFQIAMVHIGMNDKDQAFAALEQAYESRTWYMTWLKTAPELDSLRSDPRFADLVRRVGLPP